MYSSKKRRTGVECRVGPVDCEDERSSNEEEELGGSFSGGGSEGDSSSSVESDMEVEVEFEARSIDELDYHGIRRLLQQLFLKADVNLSSLADIVVSQGSRIGSVVKIRGEGVVADEETSADTSSNGHRDVLGHVTSSASTAGAVCNDMSGYVGTGTAGDQSHTDTDDSSNGDNEVYGVATLVVLDQRECCQGVKSHLQSHCTGNASEKLSEIMDDSNIVGLLLKERFLNIPADIVPPLLHSLLKEWEEHGGGACNYVVTVARSHMVIVPATGKKRKKSSDTWNKEDLVLDFQEDVFFLEEAEFVFSYPVSGESDLVFGGQWSMDDTAMKPFRTAMFLTPAGLLAAVAALERTLISN